MEPDWTSNSTTYCDTALLPKVVANMDPHAPSSVDDDDGEDVGETVAIVASVSVAVIFLVVVGYCVYSRRKSAAPAASNAPSASGLHKSLLSPSEKAVANNSNDCLFLRESRNSSESVEL
jgi:hypothetical protein